MEGPLGSLHILGWEAQWGERIRTFSNPKDKKFQRTRQPVGGGEGQVSAELGHASAPPTPYYPSSAPARDFPVQRRGGEPKRKVRRRLGGAAPLPFAVRVLDPERQAGRAAALGRAGPGRTGGAGTPCGEPGPLPSRRGGGRSWFCCLC